MLLFWVKVARLGIIPKQVLLSALFLPSTAKKLVGMTISKSEAGTMSLLNTRVSAVILTGVAAAMLPASAVQAGVVVAVSGPSAGTYPVGKKISNSETIALKAGDVLTVLDGGNTRVLRGAADYKLGTRRTRRSRSAYSALTRQRSAQRLRTGATRGVDGARITRTNLWYVDVEQAGAHCLASRKNLRLWRPTTVGDVSYEMSTDSNSGSVQFEDGGLITAWSLTVMPLTTGEDYVISALGSGAVEGDDGAGMSVTVNFIILDEVSRDPEELAAKLIENGCMAQLELLANVTLVEEG